MLKEEGNRLAEIDQYPTAIEKYTKAITIGEVLVLLKLSNSLCGDPGKVDDHRVLSNRSKALLAVGNFHEALNDAERCCMLRPFWPKVCVCTKYAI